MKSVYWRMCKGERISKNGKWRVYTGECIMKSVYWRMFKGECMYIEERGNRECTLENV